MKYHFKPIFGAPSVVYSRKSGAAKLNAFKIVTEVK